MKFENFEPISTFEMGGEKPNLAKVFSHFAYRANPLFTEDPLHELASGLFATAEELQENVPVQPVNSTLEELEVGTVYVAQGSVAIDSHGYTDGIPHQ